MNDVEQSREYMRDYMRKYRAEKRGKMLEILGGSCVKCGTTERLEIDHVDPTTKVFEPSGVHRAWSEILEELTKCQLLCQSCHLAKTQSQQRHGCGTDAQYRKRGCRCEPCTLAYRAARVAYREKQRRLKDGLGIGEPI